MQAIASLGLVEARSLRPVAATGLPACACAMADCGHLPTWKAAELDHVFVSPAFAGQVQAVAVLPELVENGLSDHVPIVLDLALTDERTAHPWDEEAFAREIGRRHGPAGLDNPLRAHGRQPGPGRQDSWNYPRQFANAYSFARHLH